MTKAAILPFPGDPFLFTFWMTFFNQVWGKEVDKLYIVHNSPADKLVVRFIENQIENNPKIEYYYYDNYIEHGEAIRRVLPHVKEELVMLIEDDGFIFKPGKVTSCFQMIESGFTDIVAGHRASCHEEIVQAAYEKFKPGTDQPNFWPNFLFLRADHLRQAGDNYGSRAWKKGETIEPLDHVVQNEIIASDTLVEASLKLRAMGLKVTLEDQYHGMTDDAPDIANHTNIWDGRAAWCHIGSLSSGMNGVLTFGDFWQPLSKWSSTTEFTGIPGTSYGLPNYCNTDQERLEWERRVTFWMLAWKYTSWTTELGGFAHFAALYELALIRLIQSYNLSTSRILKRMAAYERVLGIVWA